MRAFYAITFQSGSPNSTDEKFLYSKSKIQTVKSASNPYRYAKLILS